jgi:hypothetical protein
MKKAILALAILGLSAAHASICPDVLGGGALIAHYDPAFVGTDPDHCDHFYNAPLTNCDDQVNRIDTATSMEVIWFVVAAFDEEKIWCECQFGLSDYNPSIVHFMSWEACFPPEGGIEETSPGWPGPLAGTTLTTTDVPWEGNFIPMYLFNAYVYGGVSGVVQLTPNITVPVPFGGFGNCASPPVRWDAQLGGMGVNEPGTWVCWDISCYPPWVCCVGDDCILVNTQWECEQLDGELHPEWDSCMPNPCEVLAACCWEWICVLSTQAECTVIGGEWHPEWESCGPPNPCSTIRVCCVDGECYLDMTQEECEQAGGTWHPEWDRCEPNPCVPSDIEEEPWSGGSPEVRTWGRIKSLYR